MSPWHHSPIVTLFQVLIDRNRVMRQNSLMWVLTICTEQQRPLGPMLEALAQDEGTHYWSTRLRELVKFLNAGLPLPDALERVPGLLPPNVVLAIRVGAETNTLPAMLRESAKDFNQQENEAYSNWKGTLAYLAALLLTAISVVAFVMYFIIPKMKKIFEDFGTELPAITRWIIELSNQVVQWFPFISLGCLFGWAYLAWTTRHGTGYPGLFHRLFFSQTREQAPVLLRILSVVVDAGRPLVGAISTMARHHQSASVRNHLLYLRNEIERGGEIWDQLDDIGMLHKSEARILESASRAGNLPWAMQEIAESIDRNVDYRTSLILEIVRPVILLAMSILVGIFVIGLFMPLIKLINDLS